VLEELRPFTESAGVALATSGKTAIAAIGRVGGSLLPLLVVEGVGEVHPKATVVTQNPPDFIEDVQEVADEIVRMGLVT
jgi:hypothetical protein